MKGSLTPGTFQAFFQYMNMSSEPITELSYMTNSLQSALASMERVYELLDEPEMEAEPEAPKRIGHALGAVEFSHVRFGQLLVNRHFVSFIHSFFMIFQALDPRQKVVSHHLMIYFVPLPFPSTAITPFFSIAFSNCVVFDLPNGTYGAISLIGFSIVLLKNL